MATPARISIFLAVGILVIGLGLFARQLGLDPSPGWGKGRLALMVAGMLVSSLPWILRQRSRSEAEPELNDLFTLPALLLVIGVYGWFITVSYGATSNYYSLLATSFRNRELSLPLTPDPALLQLNNPYDPAAREGIKFPVDLSLYNGKFYLYWGPAPALLLAMAQPFLPGKITEVMLLFGFLCGIFLVQYLLILHIWEEFFRWHIPKWMVFLSILLAGFANPAVWLLSQPKIYEAAIAGGQFFFLAGFLCALLALDRQRPSRWGLALAGAFWALAVGTRSVALLPVIFMIFMLAYLLFKSYLFPVRRVVIELVPLGLPLFVGALGIAWYNWARFGSVAETGFTYQLAAPFLQKHLSELFEPAYVFQNLYNYILNPFAVRPAFPFVSPIRGQIEEILPWQVLPELYTAQAVTGFLWAVPFLVFAVVPLGFLVGQLLGKHRLKTPAELVETRTLNWIITSLLGSFLFPFLSLLAFFWAAMRYTYDFMPALTLLSTIGFWQGYQRRSERPDRRKVYAALAGLLAAVSIVLGVLLALSIYYTNGLLGQ